MPRPARSLRLPCPVCGADPGAPCFSSLTGEEREFHAERRALAKTAPDPETEATLDLCRTTAPALAWRRDGYAAVADLPGGQVRVSLTRVVVTGAVKFRREVRKVSAADVARALADVESGQPAPRKPTVRAPALSLDDARKVAPELAWTLNQKGAPCATVNGAEISANAERVYLRRGADVSRFTVGGDLAGAITRATADAIKETP